MDILIKRLANDRMNQHNHSESVMKHDSSEGSSQLDGQPSNRPEVSGSR